VVVGWGRRSSRMPPLLSSTAFATSRVKASLHSGRSAETRHASGRRLRSLREHAVCMRLVPEVFEVRDDDRLHLRTERPPETLRAAWTKPFAAARSRRCRSSRTSAPKVQDVDRPAHVQVLPSNRRRGRAGRTSPSALCRARRTDDGYRRASLVDSAPRAGAAVRAAEPPAHRRAVDRACSPPRERRGVPATEDGEIRERRGPPWAQWWM